MSWPVSSLDISSLISYTKFCLISANLTPANHLFGTEQYVTSEFRHIVLQQQIWTSYDDFSVILLERWRQSKKIDFQKVNGNQTEKKWDVSISSLANIHISDF